MRPQFGHALAAAGGGEQHLRVRCYVLAEPLERRFDSPGLLGGLYLVALCQHDRVGDGRNVEPPHRLVVALLQSVPAVDEHEDPEQVRPAAQIVAHQGAHEAAFALATAA